MYINQFSVVVFKRQHYVFHIITGYTFVRQFPVLQFPPPEISVRHFPVLQIQRPLHDHSAKITGCGGNVG